jgi:hypothetical protein
MILLEDAKAIGGLLEHPGGARDDTRQRPGSGRRQYGRNLMLRAGDALIIAAGTGNQCLAAP